MSELIKNIIKSNSIFAKNTVHTTIDGFFPALKGLANKLTPSNALKSSLGEFSERYAELVYKESHEKIVAFNIIDNKKVFLDAAEVYLLRKKRKDLVEGDMNPEIRTRISRFFLCPNYLNKTKLIFIIIGSTTINHYAN